MPWQERGAWSFWGWSRSGLEGLAAVALLLPVYLFALIAWTERVVLLARAVRGFTKSRSLKDVYGQIGAHRRNVVEAVAQAV